MSGLICPKCRCRSLVMRTVQRPGFVLRRRRCSRCDWRGTSKETFVNEAAATDVVAELGFSIAQLLEQRGLQLVPPSNQRAA